MVLSSVQQVFISVLLVFCVFVVMPRMFGGSGRSPRGSKASSARHDPHQQRHDGSERLLQSQMNSEGSESKTYQSFQQMRNAMEKEIKTERARGNGKDFALTLMPLYAVGVGVFALYKFLKMKSEDESLSKKEKTTEVKTKETGPSAQLGSHFGLTAVHGGAERQLLELEQHLAQTEKMLNSLLNQLDPLSSCINALASEQKDEIMVQLESIRKLMKESGLDKSTMKPEDISHTCQERLEDLIQSFSSHPEADMGEADDNENCVHKELFEDIEEHCDEEIHKHYDCDFMFSPMQDSKKMEDAEVIDQEIAEPETGLRRRIKNELGR